MSSNLTPQEPFALKHTNVSNPSIIHSKPSQQSITASEDYFSLSGSSASSTRSAHVHDHTQSQHTITRYQTPPSRYRTPKQSSSHLRQHSPDRLSTNSKEHLSSRQPRQDQSHGNGQNQARSQPPNQSPTPEVARQAQYVAFEQASQEPDQGRKTPMRGEGRRRSSQGENPASALLGAGASSSTHNQDRTAERGARGQRSQAATAQGQSGRSRARSSVAMDLDRNGTSPTPGVDDTPFIRFALDQLTLDEEVRGSRSYGDLPPSLPYQSPSNPSSQTTPRRQARTEQWPHEHRSRDEDEDVGERLLPQPIAQRPVAAPSAAVAVAAAPALPPPPRDLKEGPDVFIPVPSTSAGQPPLDYLPGILRTPALGAYLALLLAYIICLIFAASWSVANTGVWDYGTFGDGRYFVFQFLPTMLGVVLLLWLFQIEIAVFRITPFIAVASTSPHRRAVGARLPLQPHGFVVPYLGHFRAGQPVVGVFLLIAWLQVFQLPLLGSCFNVYYAGSPSSGHWRWIATQGIIWVVIALYILLFAALVLLHLWLRRSSTGLKWDPKSLADIVVLLERSNALDPQDPMGQLGYWCTAHRPNEILHTFGIADKPARSYTMENGQIREKVADPAVRRYSDPDMDIEAGQPRASKDAILPSSDAELSHPEHQDGPLPWFLWPSFALLWPIIALVLLLAFLIVSYLPSTRISAGFLPGVPAPVDTMGFSSVNFLYSFVPGILGTLLLLFWTTLEHHYRRLQPLASLSSPTGALAEHTLLTTYPSDPPVLATLSALANAHYRLALLTLTSLLTLPIPVLAGGVFWAQFDVPTQRTRVTANMTAFYALTVFVTLHAFSYLLIFPPRRLCALPPRVNNASLADLRALCTQSRLLQDLAFRAPVTRSQLVTRLLAPFPGMYLAGNQPRQQNLQLQGEKTGSRLTLRSQNGGAGGGASVNASRVSLADGVRGFGRARPPPLTAAVGSEAWNALPRYAFGRHTGRDGREFVGVDRVRA